ncbi:hypothetical protein CISG_00480 [Coccidioides immitis RMSCC 3703]|uniref:Uncharacterized protein n=1 Tax=Coccidioides immitis RMSCC 3703 TaxID=454286 RepID=A0A0J8QI91_COCIT|nr:hypothetical protein CISG_00480 [Coccidioides immitis RMSCC 3703]
MPGTTVPPHRKDLFYHLLKEFLQITDLSDRVERTSDLLTRFAPLYDVGEVLSLVPDSWSVDILSGFLVRVLRGLVAEKREVKVQRALSAGLNLRVGVEMLETSEDVGGGWVEDEDSVRALREEKKKVDTGKGKSHAGHVWSQLPNGLWHECSLELPSYLLWCKIENGGYTKEKGEI